MPKERTVKVRAKREPVSIKFKPVCWGAKDKDDSSETEETVIWVSGLDKNGRSVFCEVGGFGDGSFQPFVYLEMPQTTSPDNPVRWTKEKCRSLFDYIVKSYKHCGSPVSFSTEKKTKLHYREKTNVLKLIFSTQKGAMIFASSVNKPSAKTFYIDGVGAIKANSFTVHEHSIDPIIKFTAINNLKLASWIEVKETIPDEEKTMSREERKFSTCHTDIRAKSTDLRQCDAPVDGFVSPVCLVYDIECNSVNHNSKIPDPTMSGNFIFQIAASVGRFASPEQKTVLFSLFNPHDIDGAEVRRFKTEKALLLGFRDFINESNPDAIFGYNILKFDWPYLVARAEELHILHEFSQFSRIIGDKAVVKEMSWSSSAYKEQKFKFMDACGRINVDVIIEVERNFRLPKYSLDFVAEYFLKEGKDDVTPRQLFMLVDLSQYLPPFINSFETMNRKDLRRISEKVQKMLPKRWCSGKVSILRKKFFDLIKKPTKRVKLDLLELVRDAMTITGTYNIKDVEITRRLAEKLNLWITMEAMANVTNVPMSYLHTRGQQIKVLAQVYRRTLHTGIIIPYQSKDKETKKYQGATVFEAHPGDYDFVDVFDFESLYPSMMIAYNISYDTILRPDDDSYGPDEYNMLEWSAHIGCSHDPQRRKKKAADILCGEEKHRFLKVKVNPDGSRENEGVMASIVRDLLSSRKVVKKIMAKEDAKLKMTQGLAEEEDLAFYRKVGWEVVEKGSIVGKQLEDLKTKVSVLNAEQLALKVSANSCYGAMGAQLGMIPLVEGAASVTAMGRAVIADAIAYIRRTNPNAKLIYGDTDSCMVTFEGLNTMESFAVGDKVSKATTHYLKSKMMGLDETFTIRCPEDRKKYTLDKWMTMKDKMQNLSDKNKILIHTYDANPVNLQFENLYERYMLLTKKRYIAYAVNRKGQVISTTKKGVVSARRDNCQFVRDAHNAIVKKILDKESKDAVYNCLYDNIHKLFTRQIPDSKLIHYVGINSIESYQKKNKDGIPVDKKKKPITDVDSVTDERLDYQNLPHVLLALKMLRRGDEVPANTRLEFVFLDVGYEVDHDGDMAEDFMYYRENRLAEGLKLNYLHYLKKKFSKPVTELLTVKYPPKEIVYETPEQRFLRCISKLNKLLRFNVEHVTTGSKTYVKRGHPVSGIPFDFTYVSKGIDAQVNFVIENVIKKSYNPRLKNLISREEHLDLVNAALRIKSNTIIEKFCKTYVIEKKGTRKYKGEQKIVMKKICEKRHVKRPTSCGEKMRVGTVKRGATKVIFLEKWGDWEEGSVGFLIEGRVLETVTKGRKKTELWGYDIRMETEGDFLTSTHHSSNVVENVPRRVFNPVVLVDSTPIDDIVRYRVAFKKVIDQLKMLTMGIVFVEEGDVVENEDEEIVE